VRARFGDEVHERFVDALVGSIYAADTDRFSLAAVPQLAALAGQHRSILLAARGARRRAVQATGPVFATPEAGLGALVAAAADAFVAAGGTVTLGRPVTAIEADGTGWRVDDERFDAVVVTSPARPAAEIVRGVAPEAARLLDGIDVVDVILVTLAVPAAAWPDRLRGRSGYLVPKPDQRLVTAASFGSQKWAHWRPADGSQVIRVSLGRDGLPVDHLDDEAAAAAAVDELGRHLGLEVRPTEVRVSRWPGAFPQYRPHHAERARAIAAALPAGVVAAGASHDGIGIPACIRQGIAAAERVADHLAIPRASAPEGARS
jgi:protoporphyrinogen/coproporphyrinogen III oxidase